MMKGGMGNMLKQMQQQVQRQQEEFAKKEFCGEAGAGQVKVVLSGTYQTRRVHIAPQLLKEDCEIIEDLIGAAINDAVHQLSQAQQAQLGSLAGGLPFKLPL